MIAKVTLTCRNCGKQFIMTHIVNSKEEKIAWENWMRKVYSMPVCNKCRDQRRREYEKTGKFK